MNRTARIVCVLLAAAFVLSLPFYLPSGAMLEDERTRLVDELPDDGWGNLLNLLVPAAKAEAALSPLPIDLSPGRTGNPDGYTESGYQDESITLRLETRQDEGVIWRVAFVDVTHPSQLRTASAGRLGSSRVAMISSMAAHNNAILAINANYLSNDPVKTSFEYRMGEKVRTKFNRTKDLLITDENGDFHVFVKSDKDEVQAFLNQGHTIVNAFTFGPAYIKDDVLLQLDPEYGYNPHGREPRMAIGQMGPLSYVVVLAEGRTGDSQGVTQQEMGDYLYSLGCRQAFNFDGGNSATMVFNGGYYQDKSSQNERAQSDMLFFASLVGADGQP